MAHLVKSGTLTGDKNRWATSWLAFNDAQTLFGRTFELDTCAEPATSKCYCYFISPDFFTMPNWATELIRTDKVMVGVDALSIDWSDGWWCNPPFDQKFEFIAKAIEEDAKGNHGMMMLPYEPLTTWWQKSIEGNAAKIYEPDGRYNFYESDGFTKKTGVNFGSAFVLFDRNKLTTPRERFKRGLSEQTK